jgi:hypothetical protein
VAVTQRSFSRLSISRMVGGLLSLRKLAHTPSSVSDLILLHRCDDGGLRFSSVLFSLAKKAVALT